MLTKEQVVEWLREYARVIEENRQYLIELDAAIGDADHGANMDRGFKKVLDQLSGIVDQDIGSILKTIGMTLISSVGGASGPLYGTMLMRAGMALTSKYELTADDLGLLLQAALDGVVQRGKAQPGDKTMVDALFPAVESYREALLDGADMGTALRWAEAAAEQGMLATVPLVARKGRASYLGERSVGHQDPGATSLYLLIKTLAEVVNPH